MTAVVVYLCIAGMVGFAWIAAGALRGRRELEVLVLDLAEELIDNGRVSDMTGAQILSAARRISE